MKRRDDEGSAGRRASRRYWRLLGLAAGVLLHVVAGWWAEPGFAQSTNTTFTTSTTSSSSFESPPACTVIGSSRTVETVTLQFQIGPGCIGVGNRDIANPSPTCGPEFYGNPDPLHGTEFFVTAGTENFNANIHTETITCVAAVPALPWPALLGLGGLLTGAGAWWMGRRRETT